MVSAAHQHGTSGAACGSRMKLGLFDTTGSQTIKVRGGNLMCVRLIEVLEPLKGPARASDGTYLSSKASQVTETEVVCYNLTSGQVTHGRMIFSHPA